MGETLGYIYQKFIELGAVVIGREERSG